MEKRVGTSVLSRHDVAKHWLLNLAVENRIKLHRIFPFPNTLSLNAHAVPNTSAEDYARSLLDLFDLGQIVFSSELQQDDVATHSGVSDVLERFLALPKNY